MNSLTVDSLEALFCRKWPAAMRNDLLRFRRASPRRESASVGAHQPYWMLLPQWLWSSINEQKRLRRVAPRFLQDILLAQHCLFMVFRLQDDLFDGQAGRRSLIYVSDQFLLECERVFDRYFQHSSDFHSAKRAFLQQTIHGIVEADTLQRFPALGYRALPHTYARICALFKIGSFAVCLKGGCMDLFRRVSCFADQVAVVGQILDDINDIREDLSRARLNYAAAFILHHDRRSPLQGNPSLRKIAAIALQTDVVDHLLAGLKRRLAIATSAIAPLHLAPAARYLDSYRESIDKLAKQIRRQRVKTIFGI